jgi:HAD superfamily hydrolase (TIGR01509 family)
MARDDGARAVRAREATRVTTLIFDCDGVLADTERYGHLPAFNQTFREFGLPVQWSEEDYGVKLRIGGGKERMASLLTDEFIRQAALPSDRERLAAEVKRWHERKTQLYTERVAAGELPPRPGIRRIIERALGAGWQLAVASTSARESVDAVLRVAAGADNAARFAGVFAGDIVPRKKPAPDIYLLALERLGAERARTLVIEDSQNGLEAASAAELRCLVTVNGYTERERFDTAALVVSQLGDPGEPLRVLQNRSRAQPGRQIELEDLLACLPGGQAPGGT